MPCAGFMAVKCVKACGLCYPTLPAQEFQRMQNTFASTGIEDIPVQNALDTATFHNGRGHGDQISTVAQGDCIQLPTVQNAV